MRQRCLRVAVKLTIAGRNGYPLCASSAYVQVDYSNFSCFSHLLNRFYILCLYLSRNRLRYRNAA